MRWWKALGLASFVGVAATGVVIARADRRRRAYQPEQIRARLHERLVDRVHVDRVNAHPRPAGDVDAAYP